MTRCSRNVLLLAACWLVVTAAAVAQGVSFLPGVGRLVIRVDGKPFAVYVYADGDIPRPFFCAIHAPDGTPVTRNHPPDPVQDKDNDDHAGFHPGAWLAFGDLGGSDFWRNKARVRHVRFEQEPEGRADEGRFTVINAYETMDAPNSLIAEETCTYTISVLPEGWLLRSDSIFTASTDGIVFGDQEEMGFGARLATRLTVKHGSGMIWNDGGGRNEAGTWGRTARWCAAAGVVEESLTGLAVLAAPENFRPCWFHTRDYGLIVANPFGKKAMTAPDDDKAPLDATPLPPGAPFRLGFGLFVFSAKGDRPPDMEAVWRRFSEEAQPAESPDR